MVNVTGYCLKRRILCGCALGRWLSSLGGERVSLLLFSFTPG